MGGDIYKFGLRVATASAVASAALLFACAALADCALPPPAPGCAAYLAKLPAGTCLTAGNTFVLKNGVWTDTTGINAAVTSSKVKFLNFFYVVDANAPNQGSQASQKFRKAQKNQSAGLVFIAITRSFDPLSQPAQVELSHNYGADKTSESLNVYSTTMEGGAVDDVLDGWGTTSSQYIFDTSLVSLAERAKFDLGPPSNPQSALHARLYTFAYGNALECIPFLVGNDSSLKTIDGKELNVFGGGANDPDHFTITIQPAN
jgi:hypothetical protein